MDEVNNGTKATGAGKQSRLINTAQSETNYLTPCNQQPTRTDGWATNGNKATGAGNQSRLINTPANL